MYPTRSPGLTSLDLVSKVYKTKSNNIEELNERIVTISNSIIPEVLENVSSEFIR